MISVFECVGLVLWCDVIILLDKPRRNQGRGLVDCKLVKAPPLLSHTHAQVILLLAVLKQLFCFFLFLVILDMA